MRKTNCKALFAFTLLLMDMIWILLVGCGDVEVLEEDNDRLLKEEVTKTTGSIEGIIVPQNIGSGVTVVKEGNPIKFVMANAQGEYTISNLSAGEYNLEVTASDHFVDISLKRVQLIPGQLTLAEKVTLRPWSDAATVAGSVLDAETGQPIEKANIRIECTTSVCSSLFTATEADGSFKIDIWPDLESNLIINKISYKMENIRVKPLGQKGKAHLKFKLKKQW